MSDEATLMNKTGRAVIAVSIIIFCVGTIFWLLGHGNSANTLHQSALSWSYTTLMICMAAVGLDAAVSKILPMIVTPK